MDPTHPRQRILWPNPTHGWTRPVMSNSGRSYAICLSLCLWAG